MLHIRAERFRERLGSVTGTVVCHHRGDDHSGIGEEPTGTFPEPGSGFFFLIVQDL